jgi:hypothetical protein
MILPKIQPGYDFQTAFHTVVSAGSNTINSWRNTHLLVATNKKMVIAVGEMAPPSQPGQEKYAPAFVALNDAGLARPAGALTMESLLGNVMLYIDSAAVDKGLAEFLKRAGVPASPQPLTSQSLQAIATKYKAVQQYTSMNTSLMAALGIKQ